ncbi:MAG: sigma-70 family RNA polymerase sigma factor [Polyangiales bacterium]
MPTAPQSWLTEALRDALRTLARRRVPERDVEDVVQVVLAEAAASKTRPEDPTSARRWLYGILRNKIADYHRKPAREELVESVGEGATSESPDDPAVKSLLEWAMRELPSGMDSPRTLEWLLRESEGETLEEIAKSERVSPEQVRQRVSRLRRFFRERWAAQALALGLLAGALAWLVWPRAKGPEVVQSSDRTARPGPSNSNGNVQLPAGGAQDAAIERDAGEREADAGDGATDASDPFTESLRSIGNSIGSTESSGSVSAETGSTPSRTRPRTVRSGRSGFAGSGP